MKEQWNRLAEKFDTMTLRERALVAGGVIVVTVYMSYFLLVDPLVTAQPRLVQAIKQERAMLKAVDSILMQKPAGGADDEGVKRAYQDALAKQIEDLNQALAGMQKGLVPPDQMAKLLEGVVVQVSGVELVSLRKLPVERVRNTQPVASASSPATPERPEAPASATDEGGGVYQHGFEITIHGSYAGIHDYLARLEKLPWRMFWGKLNLDADRHPVISLTMNVYTLSLERKWLTL